MIYPPHFPDDYENIAEKRVYHALSALPADYYDVYFQKTFSGSGSRENDDYEIDFLPSLTDNLVRPLENPVNTDVLFTISKSVVNNFSGFH